MDPGPDMGARRGVFLRKQHSLLPDTGEQIPPLIGQRSVNQRPGGQQLSARVSTNVSRPLPVTAETSTVAAARGSLGNRVPGRTVSVLL